MSLEPGVHVLVEIQTDVGPIPTTGRISKASYTIRTVKGIITATEDELAEWGYKYLRNVAGEKEVKGIEQSKEPATSEGQRGI